MVGDPPFQVKDPSRMHCLVMPSPRSYHQFHAAGGPGSSVGQPLGGGKLGAKTVFPTSLGLSGFLGQAVDTGGGQGAGQGSFQQQQQSRLAVGLFGGNSSTSGDSSSSVVIQVPELVVETTSLTVPCWATPVGYALCGLGMGLCNLLCPGYIQACAHILCPVWSLSLGLHIASGAQQLQKRAHDSCWVWTGVLTLMLLPFVIVIGSSLFVFFYLLVFAAFSSGTFWKRLQGVPFILSWFCWGGFLFVCALGLGVALPPQMHLCVAAFFSISLGVLNGGGCKFIMRLC